MINGLTPFNTPAGSSITNVRIGPLDRVPPAAVDPTTIGVAAFPNRIELQWKGSADDPGGIGLSTYAMWRDGSYFGMSPAPIFVDATVTPGSSHTYVLFAIDEHNNYSATASTTVQAAPADTTEPRRVGVRSTGTYWGAAGEQIDLLSGNLNFSLPLLNAKSRGGWGASFALSYNSQIWRQDPGGTWKLGRDVGYGLGWKLLAGSITPVYDGTWNIHHYVFTDSSGGEYRLDVNANGVWTSHEGFYGSYDTNTHCLYFPDGSYWGMGAQSAGNEEDAGTVYPTAFYDTNGNWIEIAYAAGVGAGVVNSSARITTIKDSRSAPYWAYQFTYNTDPIPHLTGIQCWVASLENYAFSYLRNQTLKAPFGNELFGVTTLLSSVTVTGLPAPSPQLNAVTSFQYDQPTGELTQMTTPMGGSLVWHYRTYAYSGSRRYREVDTRQMIASAGATASSWSIVLPRNSHYCRGSCSALVRR